MKIPNTKLLALGKSPDADWRIILSAAVILGLLVILINLASLLMLNREAKLHATPEEGILTLDLGEIKKTTSYYEKKSAKAEAILSGQTSIPSDPSN